MNSYFADRDVMYFGNDDIYCPHSRQMFINKINNWLLTERGNQAKIILHSLREGTHSYNINDSTQLNEDIIYLLYKYTDMNSNV